MVCDILFCRNLLKKDFAFYSLILRLLNIDINEFCFIKLKCICCLACSCLSRCLLSQCLTKEAEDVMREGYGLAFSTDMNYSTALGEYGV